MAIIVNLDVMLAIGALRAGRYIDCEPLNSENRQGQGRAFHHSGGYLPSSGLPAGRYTGVQGG